MRFRIVSLMTAILAGATLAMPASAQFGPDRIAAPDAEEIYADKAMQNGWYDDALENYKALCEDRARQSEVWGRNCRKLADLHRRGLGTPQDYTIARDYYDDACFDGKIDEACMTQANVSHRGTDGDRDWTYARKLYKRACDLGNQTGCAGLGSMLYRGQGGAMERERGKDLMQRACSRGDDWACERVKGYGISRNEAL